MIGGFKNKVSDIDFKYTIDPSRIFWVKTFYPHLGKLVSAIQNIDYKSYTYNGDCNYIIVFGDDRKTEVGDTIVIDVKRDTLNYSFFGGICYELLNDSSKNRPSLSDYVDPTGDIDVIVEIPIPVPDKDTLDIWEMVNPIDGCKCELIDMLGYLNPYYRDIALWIHITFVEIVAQLQLDIPNSVDFDIGEYYIQNTFDFREEIVGKSHVIMYVEGGHTIKIQLIYKIVSEDGGIAVIDHVVEFLITTSQSKQARQLTIKDSVVNIQSMLDLFIDNFEAHQKRTSFILKGDVSKYHKPINHTCRILYLFEYMTRNRLESYDWLNSFKRKIIDPFKSHRAYNTFNGSLIYYKIIKGVFKLDYLSLDDIINAYCHIFMINHVIGVCSNMDGMRQLNEKYLMIQALILNNVREKSIPQSLKASINRLRVDAGKRKTIKKQNKRKERAKRQSSKKHLY
jgi:hypothetical protein